MDQSLDSLLFFDVGFLLDLFTIVNGLGDLRLAVISESLLSLHIHQLAVLAINLVDHHLGTLAIDALNRSRL